MGTRSARMQWGRELTVFLKLPHFRGGEADDGDVREHDRGEGNERVGEVLASGGMRWRVSGVADCGAPSTIVSTIGAEPADAAR